jgi:hypothetical protein
MESAMATTDPLVLADSAEVALERVEDIHATRFAEFFLVHRDAESGKLVAECYNTMYTAEGIPDSKALPPRSCSRVSISTRSRTTTESSARG